MQHWHVSLNAGTQRRRMRMAALFMEGWGMESLLGGPRWDLCSSLSSISSQERGILFWNFIWTFFITSAQVYLGSDFRSILTGMVSIDARGRVGVQEVKKRQICENKNRKTRERVGVQQQKIPCLILPGWDWFLSLFLIQDFVSRWNTQSNKRFLWLSLGQCCQKTRTSSIIRGNTRVASGLASWWAK